MKEIDKMNISCYEILKVENEKLKGNIKRLLKSLTKADLSQLLFEIKFLKRDWNNGGKFVLK